LVTAASDFFTAAFLVVLIESLADFLGEGDMSDKREEGRFTLDDRLRTADGWSAFVSSSFAGSLVNLIILTLDFFFSLWLDLERVSLVGD